MSTTYEDLVQETFISSIRNVLMVDDNFPTFEQLLSEDLNTDLEKLDKNSDDKGRALNLFRSFRKLGYACDIEDRVESEGEITKHLHHSDLLILDYHLIPGVDDDPSLALNVINKLAESSHFNIVVIYTSESNLKNIAQQVFTRISKTKIANEKNELIDGILIDYDLIDQWDDLKDKVNFQAMINFNKDETVSKSKFPRLYSELEQLNSDLNKDQKDQIIEYLLKQVTSNQFQGKQEYVQSDFEANNPWIQSENIFVTFINKSTREDEIIDILRDSIQNWRPDPITLIKSYAKNKISDIGFEIQKKVEENSLKYASWLYHVKNVEDSKKHEIGDFNLRVLSDFTNQFLPDLDLFTIKVINSVSLGAGADDIMKYYNIDISETTNLYKALNQFISCEFNLPEHLNIGTVIKRTDNEDYWMCLNNSCDLMPDQTIPWEDNSLGNFKPFTAVKLSKYSSESEAIKNITGKQYLCIDGKVFKFIENEKPHYEIFFAEQKGKVQNQKIKAHSFKGETDSSKIESNEFKVVAQLRNDFALVYMQQLHNFKTRIGVDYISKA